MARIPLFFLATGMCAVVMVGGALSPLRAKPAVVVEARLDKGRLVFDGQALNALRAAPGFPVTPAPGPRAVQDGPRLASFKPLTDAQTSSTAAQIQLEPKTGAALAGGPVTLLVQVKPVEVTPAKAMAIGLVRARAGPADKINWVQSPLSGGQETLRIALPANAEPATALAIWPSVEGQGHGIELLSIAWTKQPL